MALNIPAAVTQLQTEVGRVRTQLGFANDGQVDTAIATLATIQATADKLQAVIDAFEKAQSSVSRRDPG